MKLGMSLRPLLAITFAAATLYAQEGAVETAPQPTAGAYTVEIGSKVCRTPGELREGGLNHAARFTSRACGEAVLAGYESALTN